MSVCHFLMRDWSLSRVSESAWKSARQFRPFSCSEAILVPCVLVQRVFPQLRTLNMLGALMSYHSFLRKGSPAFFLPPFLPPLVRRLFLPTAIFPKQLNQNLTT